MGQPLSGDKAEVILAEGVVADDLPFVGRRGEEPPPLLRRQQPPSRHRASPCVVTAPILPQNGCPPNDRLPGKVRGVRKQA